MLGELGRHCNALRPLPRGVDQQVESMLTGIAVGRRGTSECHGRLSCSHDREGVLMNPAPPQLTACGIHANRVAECTSHFGCYGSRMLVSIRRSAELRYVVRLEQSVVQLRSVRIELVRKPTRRLP